MNGATIIALLTSTVALLSAAFAIFKWRDERSARDSAIKTQHQQWEKTFEDERQKGVSEWQIQFLRDIVQRRVGAYPDIFRTLAAVRDVGGDDHLRTLQQHPERLLVTAEKLLTHLYGEAGLVMSMNTRNALHGARMACLRFQSEAQSIDGLVNSFFYARRQLRLDIQIADSQSFTTALRQIGDERSATPKKSTA